MWVKESRIEKFSKERPKTCMQLPSLLILGMLLSVIEESGTMHLLLITDLLSTIINKRTEIREFVCNKCKRTADRNA